MSGYWDALTRTALGLAGTAQPRPRSLFEPDAGAEPDLLDAERVMAPSAPDAPGPPTSDVMVPASPIVSASDRSDPSSSSARGLDESTAAIASPQQRDASDVQATEAAPVVSLATDPVVERERIVERVEVHRVETRHVIAEAVPAATVERTVAPDARVERVPAHAAAADRDERALEESGRGPEPPRAAVLIAEPAAGPVAEPVLPALSAHEPQPLVIEIDRIDIRIESETPAVPVVARRRDPETVPSLSDYLQRRSEARR